MLSMTQKILVVEDDIDFAEYVKETLSKSGFLPHHVSKGTKALEYADKIQPDLVVLDLQLPDMTGEVICQELRKKYPTLPIIMLTAKNSTSEKVQGLNLGADDYITKPFVPDEFIARIKARLRPTQSGNEKLVIGDLELDPQKVEVKRNGKVINLTPQEFKLLEYLMHNPSVVLSREMILNRIWSYSLDVESRVVDVYMGYLRKKIDNGYKKKLIQSVRGFGYTIKE